MSTILYPFAQPPPKGWRPKRLEKPVGVLDYESGLWVASQDFEQEYLPGLVVKFKKGFVSDGASVPRFFWRWLGPRYAPETFSAAIPHDGGYGAELFPRDVCDAVFRLHLQMAWSALPVSRRRIIRFFQTQARRAMPHVYHFGVSVFGDWCWAMHTEKSVREAREFVEVVQVGTDRTDRTDPPSPGYGGASITEGAV